VSWIESPVMLEPIATLIILVTCALLLQWRVGRQSQSFVSSRYAQLEYCVTLIQNMQKHRGLGGQSAQAAVRQREQLAFQLDRQWQDWTQIFADPSSPARETVPEWILSWAQLRQNPADFDGHCALIDRLLTTLALVERIQPERTQVVCRPSAALGLAERCRDVEDLARLRGLAVRAAGHTRCPIELEVPLRYLWQRVSLASWQDSAITLALREIQQQLLDATKTAIAPARCFELLTPSIDRALDELRRLCETKTAVAQSPPSVILPSEQMRSWREARTKI